MFPFCGHGILEYDRNNIYSTNGNKQTAYYKKKIKTPTYEVYTLLLR